MKPLHPMTDRHVQRHAAATVRKDITPLLPKNCGKVLEIGSAVGATLAWLKHSGLAHHTTAIELSSNTISMARNQVDLTLRAKQAGDLTQLLAQLPAETFDLILCLHGLPMQAEEEEVAEVAEGAEQATLLAMLHRILGAQGSLLIALPQRVSETAGSSQLELLIQSGFTVKAKRAILPKRGKQGHLLRIWQFFFGKTRWRDVFAKQFLLRVKKTSQP